MDPFGNIDSSPFLQWELPSQCFFFAPQGMENSVSSTHGTHTHPCPMPRPCEIKHILSSHLPFWPRPAYFPQHLQLHWEGKIDWPSLLLCRGGQESLVCSTDPGISRRKGNPTGFSGLVHQPALVERFCIGMHPTLAQRLWFTDLFPVLSSLVGDFSFSREPRRAEKCTAGFKDRSTICVLNTHQHAWAIVHTQIL